jgi:iron complex outermembrane recepter protein
MNQTAHPRLFRSPLVWGTLLPLTVISVCAQTAAPTAKDAAPAAPISPAAPAAKEAEVVELSPFTVSASEDNSWYAQNTLAGSRINSNLKDTPAVLDVLTSEFMQEVGVTDLAEALKFSSNYDENFGDLGGSGSFINASFAGANQGLNFNTRGQGGSLARNFINTGFRPEFYTIDRIDNSSGPNAILFGIGSAGGVANISTKRAKLNKSSTSVNVRGDENGGFQTSLDVNQVVARGKFAVRLNAIADRSQSFREHSDNHLDGVHFTAKFKPTSRTDINLELERDRRTGLIVDPRPLRERVTTWQAAGSQVLTVPTNWDTLTAAQRTTYLTGTATPAGIGALGTGTRLVVTSNGDQSFLSNQANTLQAVGATNSLVTNESLAPFSVNLSGPGGNRETLRSLAALSIDHRLANDLFLNVTLSREYGQTITHQTFLNGVGGADTYLGADPNGVISAASVPLSPNPVTFTTNSAGQLVNPYAGRLYVEGRWAQREQYNSGNNAQSSLAWKLDAGRFGTHNLVANIAYNEGTSRAHEPSLIWRGAPFNTTIGNAANLVYVRNYVTPGDYSTYHVGDWKDVIGRQWNHPTAGVLTAEWVPGTLRYSTERKINGLIAAQSFFFKNRLVTTLGIRRDEQTLDTFDQVIVKTEPYQNTAGYGEINETSPIKRATLAGNTKSLGAVYHITKGAVGVSAYYNTSNSFGASHPLRYGPDGLPSPQPTGDGTDYGLKFNLFEGKVFMDVGYYKTASTNSITQSGFTNTDIATNWNNVFIALNAPANGPQMLNTSDQAALNALKATYSDLRPVWLANADLLDRTSEGYELRLTANPIKGLRIRATYARTDSSNENFYKNSVKARAQLGDYLTALKAKNPSVNVGGLTRGLPNDLTVDEYFANVGSLIDDVIELNTSVFGSSKDRFNVNAAYDLPGTLLKGVSVGSGVSYRSANVVGEYQIFNPAKPTDILENTSILGSSVIEWSANIRYRTRTTIFGRNTQLTAQINATNLFRSSPELLVRRYALITAVPGTPFPDYSTIAPTSSFILAPRTISASVTLDF